ncbi:MAG: hypothetical protein C4320_05785 [Armatimonadota bacterium]
MPTTACQARGSSRTFRRTPWHGSVDSDRLVRRDDLLDLNDALQHPGRRLSVDISTELAQEEDVDLMRPVEGYIEAVSTGNILVLSGEFETVAVVECARCSGPLETPVKFPIDEQFPIVGAPAGVKGQEIARVVPDEEPFPIFEGNALLVEALLRQSLLLNMQVQPLCAWGWEGDCPQAREQGVIAQEAAARAEAAAFEAAKATPLSELLQPILPQEEAD